MVQSRPFFGAAAPAARRAASPMRRALLQHVDQRRARCVTYSGARVRAGDTAARSRSAISGNALARGNP